MGVSFKNMAKRTVEFVWEIIREEITGQLDERFDAIEKRFDKLEAEVAKRHEHDDAKKEFDLAMLDDQICRQIAECRRRGYTTQDERRRVTRMHEAYRARGGNHGEENEYEIFKSLPTEEDYNRIYE